MQNKQNGKENDTKLKKIMKKSSSIENVSIQNLRLSPSIMDLLKKENEKVKSNKKNTFERTKMLYLNGLENKKNVINSKLRNDDHRKVNELEKCTFRPNIKSATIKNHSKEEAFRNSDIYERQFLWKKKKIERYLTLS